MIAVDTNIVVRIVAVHDDPAQSAKARALFASQTVFIPVTVILETEWVLRHSYRLAAAEIVSAFRALAGLPQVWIENASRLLQALSAVEDGLDFADALHWASSSTCDAFVTFDKDLFKAAKAVGAPPVKMP